VRGWLLDTSVRSEPTRPAPEPNVLAFLQTAVPACISVVSLHELRFGIERLPTGRRRQLLERWLEKLALRHGLGIATRDVRPFAGLPLTVLDPWTAPTE
jgi:hypothetical protein